MVRKSVLGAVSATAILSLFLMTSAWSAFAQTSKGTVSGRVVDSAGAVLPGARVELQPRGASAVTSGQGEFSITDVPAGQYSVTVQYVGFGTYSGAVTVVAGQAARLDILLEVEVHNEVITVSGARERGEVEAINREETADNIVQVLPADVITSLPNTNIADAVGRLPSVSLERDEGEGKYIQIRGTEPRLSNVTVDGIHLPSPESVRNVKLDVIPADMVDSVEVSKTLSANQDADAIGGSVNLVTKTPTDRPYLTVLGMGGYNPITQGRYQDQFDGTFGQRFGQEKRFGVLFGGSYDYNQRGINDVEPAPTANTLPDGSVFLGPNTEDIRDYRYNRTRYGFDGELDYKLGDMSSVYLRGLFSRFNDYGEDGIYSPGISNFIVSPATDPNNTCGITTVNGPTGCGGMGFTDVYRLPAERIFSVQSGARHPIGTMLVTYEVALSQAKYEGGFSDARFDGPGASDNSVAFGVDTKNPFTPKFPVLNGVNIYDPAQYSLSGVTTQHASIFERDVVGDISLNKQYMAGSHAGGLELGFKGWDARKSSIDNEFGFSPSPTLPMSSFLSSYTDPNYYFGQYKVGPITSYNKVLTYLNANPGQFSGGFNRVRSLPNDFNLNERIWAGYVMNTLAFGKFRLQTGVRIEATQDSMLGNVVTLDTSGNYSSVAQATGHNSYTNVFPSIQAQYRFGSDTVLRAAYGMGIARPNFGDLAPYITDDPTSRIPISAGNPSLKPTHAQNFDLLLEHYIKPVGIIQIGGFYKYLTDPIYSVTTTLTSGPYTGQMQNAPINGPTAHISGLEMTWQQPLRFLPGALNGMGVRANYSYTTSRASFPVGFGRTDHPTLQRTAPNNWNFDATYDKKGLSARMGLTHNDANLWSYAFQDGATGGIHGPQGDTYLYPHTQVDAQVSYWIPRGRGLQVIVSGLNLNNEVFGFYNGSERYPIQREYYNRTVSAGLRWTLAGERK
jgi:TonB-dependent receptor